VINDYLLQTVQFVASNTVYDEYIQTISVT